MDQNAGEESRLENLFGLTGKTALVTGASSGLGAHFAHVLAAAGAHVLAVARRLDRLEQLAHDIVSAGGRCTPISADLTDSAGRRSLVNHLAQIDILVNNAGIVHEGNALDQSEAQWDQVLDTNLKAMFFTAQAAIAAMRGHARGGTIVNVASILGLRQTSGVLPYSVSKAGVIQLTKSLALEVARYNIRVNALAPGYIETDLNRDFWETEAGKSMIRRIPSRRLGQLKDLDGPLLLLCSAASQHMTGAIIAVDGGHLVSGL